MGNPNDPVYYDYMKSYSPYDNVTAKEYPNLYISTVYMIPRFNIGNPLNGLLN
ncbi:hypothetical protein [Paenimyroides ceti]|uniref:hypothetical protein n=1 Tax=Paenimyroides ceti TaxID=395087 RepID=UPI0037C55693